MEANRRRVDVTNLKNLQTKNQEKSFKRTKGQSFYTFCCKGQ